MTCFHDVISDECSSWVLGGEPLGAVYLIPTAVKIRMHMLGGQHSLQFSIIADGAFHTMSELQHQRDIKIITGWWFWMLFIFNPTWGDDPIWLYNIFQTGWNHQLDKMLTIHCPFSSHCWMASYRGASDDEKRWCYLSYKEGIQSIMYQIFLLLHYLGEFACGQLFFGIFRWVCSQPPPLGHHLTLFSPPLLRPV